MDTVSKKVRSRIMRNMRSKNTRPELYVRRLLRLMGYRYTIHVRSLPGTPDIVFKSRRKVICINGCFWHHHSCSRGRIPKSRVRFWRRKLMRNRARDQENIEKLQWMGWSIYTVWECELRPRRRIAQRLRKFLEAKNDLI
jgi:DNA mismatch endonuclease (patch repair protein)